MGRGIFNGAHNLKINQEKTNAKSEQAQSLVYAEGL